MPSPKEVYTNCDILDEIPELNRKNWIYETIVYNFSFSKF